MSRRSIKIAGAGPAGLTAAICLAKAGYDVHLYESRKTVGARFIGGFQMLENSSGAPDPMEMLQKIGIATNFFVRPLSEAVLFDHHLRPSRVSSAVPFGYMIQRGSSTIGDAHGCSEQTVPDGSCGLGVAMGISLDEGLLRQALVAGVSIHYQTCIPPHEADIIATGPKTAEGLAKEMTFTTDRPDTIWVLFDNKYAPGGYAYLFVLQGKATLGCAVTRDLPHINRYFDLSLERFCKIAPLAIQNAQTGHSFMNFRLTSSAMKNHQMYVGEAGGFQDYLFGLGLRYAFMTGYFAACHCIDKHRNYDDLWKEAFGQSQEISLVHRALYEGLGNWGLSLFVRRAQGKDFREYLTAWQSDRLWKRALLPLIKRWRLPHGQRTNGSRESPRGRDAVRERVREA